MFGFGELRSLAGRSGVASLMYGAIQTQRAFALAARQGRHGFVGDHRQWVTPVPIPNTEVKPLSPMILLSGKVGYRRLYEPRQVNPGEALLFFTLATFMSCAGAATWVGAKAMKLWLKSWIDAAS